VGEAVGSESFAASVAAALTDVSLDLGSIVLVTASRRSF
jgi:hypothetical protein